jgi:gluconolactonase
MSHRAIDNRFNELVDEFAPVNQLGTGYIFTEGPIWHPQQKHLLFSDMPGDVRRKWQNGEVSEVLRPSNMANGMTYDASHNLLACEHATSSVARFNTDGTREVLCSHFEGRELNSPNDIIVGKDGSIYFTDPTFGRMDHFGVKRPLQQGFQGVYRLPPQHTPGDEPQLVTDRYLFSQPNGLCFSPCERWMWVNDTEQANIRMFDVAGDGQLTNGRIFASGIKESLRPGVPDGMKADRNGNVYVTAPGGIWVYSFDGVKLGEISIPEMAANLHWGDDNWDTLYVCACTSVYSVKMHAQGRIEPFMFATPAHASAPSVPAAAAGNTAAPSASGSTAAPVVSAVDQNTSALVPQRTALILQDLQNDVIIDGGAFAESGSPQHAREQNVVANAARLAEVCRAQGVIVFHVWMVCEPGHPLLAQHAPLFQGLKGENALVRGTWGVQPATGLEAHDNDLVIEKMSMSAWETSRLESYLRHAGIDTIINCGAWTNMSVEHTARTGADKGFRMIVPEDACSTMNADWHRASIEYAMSNVAEITGVDDVISRLQRR